MGRKRVIIIKHGYSETCDHNISPVVSFGDVFRCTCLLEAFKGYDVTWITARSAYDLLCQNHLIDQLILADSPDQVEPEQIHPRYDILINLEKQKDWCEFSLALNADHRYGFRDWSSDGPEAFYPDSARAMTEALQRDVFRPYQQTLYESIGREWTGQKYSLGYTPRIIPIYDIGLNHRVGPKWPTKVWPESNWTELHRRLVRKQYAVSWQQSLNSIRHYIEWLSSCRLIITCDSLGLHLAIGLQRKIVSLFGPTPPEQVYLYGLGVKITPACDRRCIPCFQPRCTFDQTCMESISVEQVLEAVESLIPAPAKPLRRRPQPLVVESAIP